MRRNVLSQRGNNPITRKRRSQQRAARFRTRQESSRVIRLVDKYGNQRYVRQQGRVSITKHQTVLIALEKRALRYRRKGKEQVDWDEVLYKNALDETGTVSTTGMTEDELDNGTMATEFTERMEIEGVSDKVLSVHGLAPGKKADGVTQMIYENPNGFNSRIGSNEKLDKAKEIIDELEADVVAYSEIRINGKHKLTATP